MKINIYSPKNQHNSEELDFIIDCYYGYCQFKNRLTDYSGNLEITVTENPARVGNAVNIAYLNMPNKLYDTANFDLVLLGNKVHPVMVGTTSLFEMLNNDNCYLIAGSSFLSDNPFAEKIITFNYIDFEFLKYHMMPWFPQYYEASDSIKKNKDIIYINGQNRSHRQFLMDNIKQKCANTVDYKSTWNQLGVTLDSFCESVEDIKFRDYVNEKYFGKNPGNETKHDYYDKSVAIGPNGRCGLIPPGYFLIDEYFDYRCVVFPETNWINDEIFVTEKIIKCFITKTLPFPVGGAGILQMYNDFGYFTAWNLLPNHLKCLDKVKNHVNRYQLVADSIQWLKNNIDIFDSEPALEMIKSNYNKCYKPSEQLVKSVEKLNFLFCQAAQ